MAKSIVEEWKKCCEYDPHANYRVTLEIEDVVLSKDGLRCYLEGMLADKLSREQIGKKVLVHVKSITNRRRK